MASYAQTRRGFAPILVALGIVSLLSMLTLSSSMTARLVNNRRARQMDRLETFYSNELTAWHSYFRHAEDLSGTNPAEGNRFAVGWNNEYVATLTGEADPYTTQPGAALNAVTTRAKAPTTALTRRYRENAMVYRAPSGATPSFCGQMKVGGARVNYQACLASTAKKPRLGKILAASATKGAFIVGDSVYRWGTALMNQPGRNPTKQDLPLLANEKPISVALNDANSFFALTNQGRVFRFAQSTGPGTPFEARLAAFRGTPARVVDVHGECALTEDGKLWNRDSTTSDRWAVEFTLLAPASNENVFFEKLGTGVTRACCAISRDGRYFCNNLKSDGTWNDHLDVGNTGPLYSLDRSRIQAGERIIAGAGSSGEDSFCILTDRGNAYCWGKSDRLGYRHNGPEHSTTFPEFPIDTAAFTGTKKIVDIAVGMLWAHVVTEDGLGYSWGKAAIGNSDVCNDSNCQVITPQPIKTSQLSSGFQWQTIVGGSGNPFSCGLDRNGDAYCWGENAMGQLGNDDRPLTNSINPGPIKKTW